MAKDGYSKREWKMIHRLSAELAQRNMDVNLVQTAAAYVKANPEANFQDWLFRLVRLGDLFGSSLQTTRYRQELWAACERLEPHPENGSEWALVLSWAARLQKYYEANMRLARKVSDVQHITLPPPPDVYRPKQADIDAASPKAAEAIDLDKPASKEAEDIFARFQDLWGKKEDK